MSKEGQWRWQGGEPVTAKGDVSRGQARGRRFSRRNGFPKVVGLEAAYVIQPAQPCPNHTMLCVSVFATERSGTPRLGRHSEEWGLQKKMMTSSLKGTKLRGLGFHATCGMELMQPRT